MDLNIEDPILKLLNLDKTLLGVLGVGLVSPELLPSPNLFLNQQQIQFFLISSTSASVH